MRTVCALICLLLLTALPAYAARRNLEISGLKIFTEKKLLKKIHLRKRIQLKISSEQIADDIKNFLVDKGYLIARVYILEDTMEILRLHVDEGAFGKVVFQNIDDFDLIRVKMIFYLQESIFNENSMIENIDKIKKKLGFKGITFKLKKVKDYTGTTFQLDRNLLGKTKIPLFDEFSPQYDLFIKPSRSAGRSNPGNEPLTDDEKTKEAKIKNGFGYKLDISLNQGFIPEVHYYRHNLLENGDFGIAHSSMGIMYGPNGIFDKPPSVTFFTSGFDYHFRPLFKKFFTPIIYSNIYYSAGGRKDLGLLTYEYIKYTFMSKPGITIRDILKFYFIGGEKIVGFFNTEVDNNPSKTNKYFPNPYPVQVDKRTDYYTIFGGEIDIDIIPIRIGNPLDKNLKIAYYYHTPARNHETRGFHKLTMNTKVDIETIKRSIYSFQGSYVFLWKDPPFHEQSAVNCSAFKGLGGYYSRNRLAFSNEYRASIYRDHIYLGLYCDMTLFEGLGYEISGFQYAFMGGPTLRFLILDQLEVYLHYGAGYLVTDNTFFHGYAFGFYRKW